MNNVITSIEQQKNTNERYSVFIDGKFAFGIADIDLYNLKLKIGDKLSENDIDNIINTLDETKCRSYATSLISKRLYTKSELEKKMRQKGYCDSAINSTLIILEDYGYIDDKNYAQLYCKQYMQKYGTNKIKFDLKSKGVSENIINDIMVEFDNSNELYELIYKKTKGALPEKEDYSKLVRYFLGKGFEYDQIKNCLNRLSEDTDIE